MKTVQYCRLSPAGKHNGLFLKHVNRTLYNLISHIKYYKYYLHTSHMNGKQTDFIIFTPAILIDGKILGIL